MSTLIYFRVKNYIEKGYILMCAVLKRYLNWGEKQLKGQTCLHVMTLKSFPSETEMRSVKADNRHVAMCEV